MNELFYSGGKTGNVQHVDLTKLTLNKDRKGYYLSAKYKVEDIHSVRELDIPKIRLCIDTTRVTIGNPSFRLGSDDGTWVDLGFGELPLEQDMSNGFWALFTEKTLEEKVREMTLDEIEKKLGHKIKIVNK